jgi:hypothetical protein
MWLSADRLRGSASSVIVDTNIMLDHGMHVDGSLLPCLLAVHLSSESHSKSLCSCSLQTEIYHLN